MSALTARKALMYGRPLVEHVVDELLHVAAMAEDMGFYPEAHQYLERAIRQENALSQLKARS